MGELPPNEEALIQSVLTSSDARYNSADLNIAYKMSVDEYQKLCPYAEALEENWGKPPGTLNSNGQVGRGRLKEREGGHCGLCMGRAGCPGLCAWPGTRWCLRTSSVLASGPWREGAQRPRRRRSAQRALRGPPPKPRCARCHSSATPPPLDRAQELLVYGRQFGNVFIGVQPTFGYEGDPMRLLFSQSASPHHGFAAYYTFLERIFKADAVLHFGTHGSLEFMPGKQVRCAVLGGPGGGGGGIRLGSCMGRGRSRWGWLVRRGGEIYEAVG